MLQLQFLVELAEVGELHAHVLHAHVRAHVRVLVGEVEDVGGVHLEREVQPVERQACLVVDQGEACHQGEL